MDLIYYFWLASVEGLDSRKIRSVLEHFGDPQCAWQGTYEQYKCIKGITPLLAERMVKRKDEEKLLKEIRHIELKGINIITIDSEEYPEKLKNIYDPPILLYVRGRLQNLSRFIAVVGSRKCTSYGRAIARNMSSLLSRHGIGIISGMARGIDTEAHLGAMDEGGITWAVLGCGCDIVYPPENKKLMMNIEKTGAVISEFMPSTRPFPGNFPARNRIISGLSDGVLVVEAGERSGALITAGIALEQGREVFAVPGSILSASSKGTNKLIKDGAYPVTDIYDILEGIGMEFIIPDNEKKDKALTASEKIIMDIVDLSPIYIDDLIQKTQLNISEINAVITNLELKGRIRVLPGKYIVKI